MSKSNTNSVLLKFLLHLHPPRIPESSAKFSYTFGLGGLAIFSFLLTIITGIILLFQYSPTPESAHASMEQIATVIPYGWYVRNLHFWSAQVLVIAAVLHMLRIVLTGGYLKGRSFNFQIGLILLVLLFITDFTGFPLRWDAESHWALVVGTNLIKTIPVIGAGLYRFIVGGVEITGTTLLRFYSWHIFGLPFIASILIVYHIYRIRKDGGISRNQSDSRPATITREQLVKKEILFMLGATVALILLSVIWTPHLGLSVESSPSLTEVQAPWIFLGIQFLLRYLPPVIAGIGIPLAFLIFWAAMPYLDNQDDLQGIWAPEPRRRFWLTFVLTLVFIGGTMVAEVVA